jgi:hypothetical protein
MMSAVIGVAAVLALQKRAKAFNKRIHSWPAFILKTYREGE